MDKKKVARELVKIAKSLVAVNVQVGQVYKLNLKRALAGSDHPNQAKIIRQLYKRGDGKVKVEEVYKTRDGYVALVFEPHLDMALLGSVGVPADSLS